MTERLNIRRMQVPESTEPFIDIDKEITTDDWGHFEAMLDWHRGYAKEHSEWWKQFADFAANMHRLDPGHGALSRTDWAGMKSEFSRAKISPDLSPWHECVHLAVNMHELDPTQEIAITIEDIPQIEQEIAKDIAAGFVNAQPVTLVPPLCILFPGRKPLGYRETLDYLNKDFRKRSTGATKETAAWNFIVTAAYLRILEPETKIPISREMHTGIKADLRKLRDSAHADDANAKRYEGSFHLASYAARVKLVTAERVEITDREIIITPSRQHLAEHVDQPEHLSL
jgi:hypothetical protein